MITQVNDVTVVRMMCGKVTCVYCGHIMSAQAWHHERNQYPVKEYAFRCIKCGNPLPEPKGNEI